MANSTSDPPHRLGLVVDFVNTAELEAGTDELATVVGVRDWLQGRGLLGSPVDAASLTEDDRQTAIAVREALRSLMLANNGGAADAGAGAVLEDVVCRGDLGLHFTPDGDVCFRPGTAGF